LLTPKDTIMMGLNVDADLVEIEGAVGWEIREAVLLQEGLHLCGKHAHHLWAPGLCPCKGKGGGLVRVDGDGIGERVGALHERGEELGGCSMVALVIAQTGLQALPLNDLGQKLPGLPADTHVESSVEVVRENDQRGDCPPLWNSSPSILDVTTSVLSPSEMSLRARVQWRERVVSAKKKASEWSE
jgi:hypothetical protein